jgi:monovalent cation:H+ antiporter-2, CPA2 family
MPHQTSLIATIVVGLVLAFVLGALANRLRASPLVGYLLAGMLVGPATPGFVADLELAPQLAESGVILLMFGVGLHFSLKDLLSVRAIAVPGAVTRSRSPRCSGWPWRGRWAGRWARVSSSALPCRPRARSCSCARSRNGA